MAECGAQRIFMLTLGTLHVLLPPLLMTGMVDAFICVRIGTSDVLFKRVLYGCATLLARDGLGGERHLAHHEFVKLYLRACVIDIDADDIS